MDFNRTIITKSPEETKKLGKILSNSIVAKHRTGESLGPIIICLYGELGSGKTTFVQGFLQGLGIVTRVLSPTFIIVRRYECSVLNRSISHVDCYRLLRDGEIEGLGLEDDFSDPSGFVLIEWADRLGKLTPKHRMDITFDVQSEGHIIHVTKDSYGFTK
jgi:tRNA threonylcarbamoyladenosine biosynthesis protein TsaE